MRRAWLGVVLLVTACDYGFKPATLVENLRVLGVKAEPAELSPGQSAQLSALVPDPSRAAPASVLWIGCAPDPYNLNRTACADTSLLQDPSALTGGTGTLPPGVSIIGFNNHASYQAASDVFSMVPEGDERRTLGTVGQVLAFAVAEELSPTATRDELKALFDRVQRKEVRSIIALFRLHISESTERNTNPKLSALKFGDELVPVGAHVAVLPAAQVVLDAEVTPESWERYTATTPTATETRQERMLASWYSTMGRFSHESTALGAEVKTTLTAPGAADKTDPVPDKRSGKLWLVLRDTRGGTSWTEWPMYVCDPQLELPVVEQIEWPTAIGGTVVLHGRNLAAVLDVVVDGVGLEGGYSSAAGTWSGTLAAGLPVGQVRGEVRTKSCVRTPLGP